MAWIYPAVIEINTWMVQFHLNETHADCESDKYFMSYVNICKDLSIFCVFESSPEFSHNSVALKSGNILIFYILLCSHVAWTFKEP